MALILYRRHKRKCRGLHEEDSLTREFDERRRGWKPCECPIQISGTLAGRFSRRNTNKTVWEDALLCATALEIAGTWDDPVKPPTPTAAAAPAPAASAAAAPPLPADSTPQRVTIAEAKLVYLASRQAMVSHATFRKHRTFAKQLEAFGTSRGYVFLDQFRALDIDVFYATSKLAPRTKQAAGDPPALLPLCSEP
jgi:hypothetical protein